MKRFGIYLVVQFLAVFQMIARTEAQDLQSVYVLQFRDGHSEGSWVLVLDNGIKYEVDFSKDSNSQAVESLAALDPDILRLNTSLEHNIYLVGYLQKIARGKQVPAQAGKANLRLDGWYLKAPFYTAVKGDSAASLEVSHKLEPTHFLPAGERLNSEATASFRSSLKIQYDARLNLFWIGVGSPFAKFLSKR